MFRLPENVLKALAEYLVTRPYKEVAGLINAIQTLDKEGSDDKNKGDRISKEGGKAKG